MTLSPDTAQALEAAGLDSDRVCAVVRTALAEDLTCRPADGPLDGPANDPADGLDVTSHATIPAEQRDVGDIVARADGVLAGLPVAAAVLDLAAELVGGRLSHLAVAADGSPVRRGDVLLTVTGSTRAMLTAERTMLNLVCRLSGVATLTAAWVEALAGTGARLRDTRKTTPGLRLLEKYAVRAGGGVNHRMGLSDAALIKDNHVLAAGGVGAAFRAVRRAFPDVAVEVECATVAQVRDAVDAGAAEILLDNMPVDQMRRAVELARPHGIRLEASGGLRLANARQVAETGVDYLSVGALTHSAPVLDIAFDLRERT